MISEILAKIFFTEMMKKFLKTNFINSIMVSIADWHSNKILIDKKEFVKRVKRFNKYILPFFLNELLKEKSPQIHQRLERLNINGSSLTLPFINLDENMEYIFPTELEIGKKEEVVDDYAMKWIHNLDKNIYDDPTFTLESISTKKEIRIGVGSYFGNINTSDKYLYDFVRDYKFNKRNDVKFLLKLRNSARVEDWIKTLEKAILDNCFSHYCATIGLSVLTIVLSEGKYKYYIKTNSDKLFTSFHDKHVIPSGIFQPFDNFYLKEQKRELNLQRAVYRELGEELLGIKELERPENSDIVDRIFKEHTILNNVIQNFGKKNYTLIKTGFILDILRMRPEFTFLLIIKDEQFAQNIETNWEVKEGCLNLIDLEDEEMFHQLLYNRDTPLCPPGLAALIFGRRKALKIIYRNRNSHH